MSMDFRHFAAVGRPIVTESYAVVVPEESHMEARYDRKTGARLENVKVIDANATIRCVINGYELYDHYTVSEFIDKFLETAFSDFEPGEGPRTFVYGYEPKKVFLAYDVCKDDCKCMEVFESLVANKSRFIDVPNYDNVVVAELRECLQGPNLEPLQFGELGFYMLGRVS